MSSFAKEIPLKIQMVKIHANVYHLPVNLGGVHGSVLIRKMSYK